MKRISLFLVLSMFLSVVVHAQSKSEKQVAIAVETLRKAMVDGTKSELEAIADNNLTYGHSSGVLQNKAEFVEAITSGNSDFVTLEFNNQTIHVSGKTAIVRHDLVASTNDKGKSPGTVNLHILTVWQKTHGKWLMLARQAVKKI
ncbi:nuclear transport factor 2 family protein [Arcticibacter eurypsychrophilus]|uniref:nuclear transport factor 2 family protein n=1 Tax=Arcticibacter eurypsychrophilus TaxID=1434752 RepID=UPI00084DA98E|nr:nuclear transport factor 2 family protein [Arcticibacter eurypsychrophilus]